MQISAVTAGHGKGAPAPQVIANAGQNQQQQNKVGKHDRLASCGKLMAGTTQSGGW
jgi:hypothetical protein